MKSKQLRFISILFAYILISACNNSPENNNTTNDCEPVKKLTGERKNLNISIFLDLSDRVSPTFNPNPAMEYWKRDLGYITSISGAFEIHLRNKKTVLMGDNIKLFLHPLPENMSDIDKIVKTLDKGFTKQNATLDNICSINNDYGQLSNLIYSKTLEQKEPFAKQGKDNYPGSDIYDFFKSRVKDYCIKENRRNILFILTDGYMFMSGTNNKNANNQSNFILSKELSNWGFNSKNYQSKINNEAYTFQVPVTGLDSLEVFVIGLAPKNSWEIDVLNSYWSIWLKEMGVKNFQDESYSRYLKKADLPSEIDILIQDFIHN
jgi:hypothetical protein